MKRCPRCEQDKPVDQFGRASNRKDGLRCYFRACDRESNRASYRRNPAKTLERSRRWHQENPEVGRESTRKWRVANKDKVRAKKADEYRLNGPEIREMLRDSAFRRKYGISLRERDEMLARQHGRCAICFRHEDDNGKRLAVDHCHATGRVRALLCGNCNSGVGHFKDDPTLLELAAEYVRKHQIVNLKVVEANGA